MLVLGKFHFSCIGEKVWIENTETGEAGSFPVSEVIALVEKYFGENY